MVLQAHNGLLSGEILYKVATLIPTLRILVIVQYPTSHHTLPHHSHPPSQNTRMSNPRMSNSSHCGSIVRRSLPRYIYYVLVNRPDPSSRLGLAMRNSLRTVDELKVQDEAHHTLLLNMLPPTSYRTLLLHITPSHFTSHPPTSHRTSIPPTLSPSLHSLFVRHQTD